MRTIWISAATCDLLRTEATLFDVKPVRNGYEIEVDDVVYAELMRIDPDPERSIRALFAPAVLSPGGASPFPPGREKSDEQSTEDGRAAVVQERPLSARAEGEAALARGTATPGNS